MHVLAAFEQTAFRIWVREEWWVFPLILCIHAIGMGLIAGATFFIALRLLGVARATPLAAFVRFYPIMWIGFAANVFSGLLLLAGYPAKALTNPVFYAKLALLGAAIELMRRLRPRLEAANEPALRSYAWLALWIGVIVTGRFLAYTHTVLLASWLSS